MVEIIHVQYVKCNTSLRRHHLFFNPIPTPDTKHYISLYVTFFLASHTVKSGRICIAWLMCFPGNNVFETFSCCQTGQKFIFFKDETMVHCTSGHSVLAHLHVTLIKLCLYFICSYISITKWRLLSSPFIHGFLVITGEWSTNHGPLQAMTFTPKLARLKIFLARGWDFEPTASLQTEALSDLSSYMSGTCYLNCYDFIHRNLLCCAQKSLLPSTHWTLLSLLCSLPPHISAMII